MSATTINWEATIKHSLYANISPYYSGANITRILRFVIYISLRNPIYSNGDIHRVVKLTFKLKGADE